MRILIIEGRETIGGGQVVTKAICETLKSQHDVAVWLPGDEYSPIANYLRNFKQFYYPHKQYRSGRKGFKDYWKFLYNLWMPMYSLLQANKLFKPSILYIQHLSMLPIILIINFFLRKTIIAHIHVIYVDKRVRKLINLLLNNSTIKRILGVSNFSLSQLSGNNRAKGRVIYNPVKLLSTSSPRFDKINIAVIGDVYPSKGQHVLLEAYKGRPENYLIHVIGNIVDAKYKQLLDTKYGDVKVVYTGMINNVADYLKTNNVVVTVVSSVVGFETFSLAMVESWAQGIPTIATNDFGMQELVNALLPQYRNLLLFPLGDSNILYNKITDLLSNQIRYHKIATDVRKAVEENFSMEKFSKQLNQIIDEIDPKGTK